MGINARVEQLKLFNGSKMIKLDKKQKKPDKKYERESQEIRGQPISFLNIFDG